jgi:hypothetical protein
MSFDFIAAIKNVAPILASTFGTPLAGLAVKALVGFIPDSADAKAVQDAHASDPVSGAVTKLGSLLEQGKIAIADIAKAEMAHAETMAQLGYKNTYDLEKIAADDRDSARKRQIEMKDRTPAHLAYMIIGGFFAFAIAQLVAMLGYPEAVTKIPPQGWVVIGNISGYLAAEAKAAAGYFFGTSASSRDKDQTLADIAKS